MKFGVYTVYDCKSKEYSSPFIQREGAVERTLKAMLAESRVPAEDLTLWYLGDWDSETGFISYPVKDGPVVPIFVDIDFLGSLPVRDEEVVK